eukprot:15091489-Alexandrium_andersonii.AAC.1
MDYAVRPAERKAATGPAALPAASLVAIGQAGPLVAPGGTTVLAEHPVGAVLALGTAGTRRLAVVGSRE